MLWNGIFIALASFCTGCVFMMYVCHWMYTREKPTFAQATSLAVNMIVLACIIAMLIHINTMGK